MGIIDDIKKKYGSDDRKQYTEDKYQEFLEEYSDALNYNDSDPVCSFTLSLEESVNEYYTLKAKKGGEWKIDFYGVEGPFVDHFHLKSSNQIKLKGGKEKLFDGCIRLFKAAPFTHGRHTDELENIQDGDKIAKLIDTFLRQKSEEDKNMTRWEYFKSVWINQGGSQKEIVEKQPKYTSLGG